MEDNKTKMDLIPLESKELLTTTNSTFTLSLDVRRDLIIPIKSYLSLFPRYCITIKEFIVDFKITERDENLFIEFGYAINNNIGVEELEKHFTEYIKLIKAKNLYICLKKRTNRITNSNSFHKFCMRLEEEIRHLNRVIYLEIGLKNILELPERSSVNIKFDEELEEVQQTNKNQYENYYQFVKYIETGKDNDNLLKENERLKRELEKVDEERKRLLDEFIKVVNEKFSKVGSAINNNFDKDHLKRLLVDEKILDLFELLSLVKDENINDEIILFRSRWNTNERNKRMNIEYPEIFMIEKQKILSGLLDIINKI